MQAKSRIVLVAEDEPLIRMATAEMLTEAGFSVIEAAHAEEALSVLQARHADICVLFTDIHMPGNMDGVALAHHARQHWPSIGLLVASGKARPASTGLPSKCRFLLKPYDPDHVVSHVRELVAAG
jgi:CheY-like chemotaxis protein